MDHYLSKQPAAQDRTEIAVATLCTLFYNANRGKDQPAMNVKEFLPYLDPWPAEERYTDVDMEVLRALGR